ncbi:MAG: M81 family metallopeptidase [Holdemania filiformis]
MYGDLFEEAGIEVIPTIYADGRAGGRVTREAFDFILEQFLNGVREHIDEIDGMFFFLHGASNVLGLEGGSGEHTIIREIRKLVGPYLPIAMVMDPHGNLSQEQADNCQIIRTFRHSPHTDRPDCHRLVAKLFIDLLNNRRDIHPVYRKVPILVGGERSVSLDEPMVFINKLLDEIEADPRILCCSYHIGYVRHDNAKGRASSCRGKRSGVCEEKADQIATFAWSKRRNSILQATLEPEGRSNGRLTIPIPGRHHDSESCTAGGQAATRRF